ncbi:Phosphoglycerate mutase [Raoultella ornithinolytica]|nr:Phosphoglycerate mutase [Raoultella ornithinolytica]
MLQVHLVRHGETQWNAERRIQGQSDSPLTPHGERQAWQVGERARTLGITHIIASDLGRTRRTAEIIAEACGCDVILDSRLRELDMGVLEKRHIDSLSEEEEEWRRRLVDGTPDGRIPQGESMLELSERMHAGAGVLPGTACRKPAAAGESRYCAGLSGQYDSGTAGTCGTPPASA